MIDALCQKTGAVYKNSLFGTDQKNAIGVADLSDYCRKLETVAAAKIFVDDSNDPMTLAGLYIKFIDETPSVFLVDANPDLVSLIRQYVVQLIGTGEGLSLQRALILNTLLPAQYCQGFDSIKEGVVLPRDHHINSNVESGWYFIVGNLATKSGDAYGIEIVFFHFPVFPRYFLLQNGYPESAFLCFYVTAAVMQKSTNVYVHNASGIVSPNNGLVKYSRPTDGLNKNDGNVFLAVGNTYFASEQNDLSHIQVNLQDVDSAGNPMVVFMKLSATKPLFYQGDNVGCAPCVDSAGTLYYSYPRYKIDQIRFQFNNSAVIDEQTIDLAKSIFWLDHQWTYRFFNPSYLDNVLLRSISNLSRRKIEGWYWFLGHLDDGRDFTFADLIYERVEKLPVGDVVSDGLMGAKIIDVSGKASDFTRDCSLTSKKWTASPVRMENNFPESSTVTVYLPTECLLRIGNEEFLMVADIALPVSVSRRGGVVREGICTIYKNDAGRTRLGVGYIENQSWMVSQADQDRLTFGILSGLLKDENEMVSTLSRREPSASVKVFSVLFIIFLVVVVLCAVAFTGYIGYKLYRNWKSAQ